MPINELRAVTTFVKAAELGSLRAASAAQSISPQAASQALAQLEAHLGVRLFHRTTRQLSLTEDGHHFLRTVQPGLDAISRAMHDARAGSRETAGPLRITAPRFVSRLLSPVLEEYSRLYPKVTPRVQLDDRIGNWVKDRVDVGFRAGHPPAEGLVARRLMPLPLVVCATPGYLRQHGVPSSLDDLARHRCSGYLSQSSGKVMPWEFEVGGRVVAQAIEASFVTNDVEMELEAVSRGSCIGQLIGTTAAPLVRAGVLLPVLTEFASSHLGLYLYYGSRAEQPVRVRRFIDLANRMLGSDPKLSLTDAELRQYGAIAKGLQNA